MYIELMGGMGDTDLRERLSCLNPRSLLFQMRVVWFLLFYPEL